MIRFRLGTIADDNGIECVHGYGVGSVWFAAAGCGNFPSRICLFDGLDLGLQL